MRYAHWQKSPRRQARARRRYVGNGYTAPSIYNDGQNVPWEYGGWNLEAMDAHGGWIATARDLVRLLTAVDGFSTKPDILSAASIQTMTTASAVNGGYSLGWSVNAFDNWWHTGALDGTASVWVRANNGFTWAVILNKRVIDGNANAFWADFDNLPWNCLTQTTTFPAHDLFDVPLQASSDVVLSPVAATPGNYTINWASGSGDKRILVAKAGAPVDQFPLDGMDYTANSTFGIGDDLGDGNFVVYNSGGNGGLIQGLDENTTYHFRLFEYHKRSNTGDHALYNLCESALISTDEITSRAELADLGVRVYPNPGKDHVQLSWAQVGQVDRIELWSMQGQLLKRVEVQGSSLSLPTQDLPTGMYLLSGFRAGTFLGSQRWMKY
ncbi:MAG: serine hydrolase [Bacteroidota bacterium]